MKQEMFKANAYVLESLPNLQFLIELEDKKQIRAYLSGRMNMNKIKVLPGDKVMVELSPTIPTANQIGRIIYRK